MVARTLLVPAFALLALSCGEDDGSGSRAHQRVPKLNGPELVPEELVAALLTGFVAPGREFPEIVVGRVPDEMPFEVPLPPNARVVGAISRPTFGTLVLSVPERPLDAMKAYRDFLRRTGWDDPGREHGTGFEPPRTVHSGTFCQGESRSISTAAAQRSDKETFLQVQYREASGRSLCDQTQFENPRFERGPMPTLYPPQNTSIVDASVGGGRNHSEASARLETDLDPAQLVAHYGTQLRADGWAPRSDPSGKELAAQQWSIEDRRGNSWVAVLVALRIPNSEHRQVLFRVMPSELKRQRE
jgi:hypothetical protein